MAVSVFDIISIVRTIHEVCEDVSSSKKVVQVAGEKLQAMIPLLEMLKQQDANNSGGSDFVKNLHKELKEVYKLICRAKQMNSVLYVIKASSIHDDIEAALRRVHFSLGALSVRQNIGINQQLQLLQLSWEKREEELFELKVKENEQKRKLLQGKSQADIVGNLINATEKGTNEELHHALEAIKKEREDLNQVLDDSIAASDSVRQSKVKQEEEYLEQIIAALAWAENLLQQEEDQGNGVPDWAVCPVTHQIMSDPVTVDSLCLHNCQREVMVEWLDRGHMTCPACSHQLRSSAFAPNAIIRDAIQDFCQRTGTLKGSTVDIAKNDEEANDSSREEKPGPTNMAVGDPEESSKQSTTFPPSNQRTVSSMEEKSEPANMAVGYPEERSKQSATFPPSNQRTVCYGALVLVVFAAILGGVLAAVFISRPTEPPTEAPTMQPTTVVPSDGPPTQAPKPGPTTIEPTIQPTVRSTPKTTEQPSSIARTNQPLLTPTLNPITMRPSAEPSPLPTTYSPTGLPTSSPTPMPTNSLTLRPTKSPTPLPTTYSQTVRPTSSPTPMPTIKPTLRPTRPQTPLPTNRPTRSPADLAVTSLSNGVNSSPFSLVNEGKQFVLAAVPPLSEVTCEMTCAETTMDNPALMLKRVTYYNYDSEATQSWSSNQGQDYGACSHNLQFTTPGVQVDLYLLVSSEDPFATVTNGVLTCSY